MKNLLIRNKGSLILIPKRFLLFIVLLLAAVYSEAQVHANFAATPNSGCAPLVVDFKDISSGNPTSWKWDLDNGTTSLLQNPSVTYFVPGKYNITLITKNSQGEDSVYKSGFIEVYSAPQVNFSATPQSGCFPLPAQFTDHSVAGSGSLSGWEWDFGDGELSTDQNPKHTYLASGNFNVSLRISSNFGCVASITNSQFIQISTGVKASFSNSLPATCNQAAAIQFSNSSTGTGALSYQWKFGDGAVSSIANPTHYYSVGNYAVTLIVANANGCADTIVKPNAVIIGNVKADFSVAAIVCQGTDINFINASNPTPSASIWMFGDGSTSNAINPLKAYANAGNYTVKLVAGFGACKDSISKSLLVTPKPSVDFMAGPTNSCKAPVTVNFKNVTTAATSFSWDFGDGVLSNLPNPAHTYLKEGFYSVTLTVTNAAGCTNNIIKKDFIKIKTPTASLNNLPQKGCAPLPHSFSATINSVDSIASYNWDFGDGSTSTLINPTHIYITPGIYDVALSYTTVSGCTFSVSVISGILVGSKPTAKFAANPLDVCASSAVNFKDQSSANANKWLWQFGDGASSLLQNPDHQYVDTGYFSVTLISNNNGCPDTLVIPNYVHVKAPVAKFKYAVTCAAPGHVVFTDFSIGADTWSWTFGDGSTSSIQNPVHDYATSGVYNIQLTVTNKTTGCDYTKIDAVTVLKEIADYNSSVTAVCKNIPVIFNAINSNQQNINSYTWLFGDGVTASASVPSTTHNYKVSGSFNVTMILTLKNGCKDSIVKPLAIVVDGPSAVFKSSGPGECLDNAISFIDSSYANGSSPVQQWQWNWGDGNTQNLSGPNFQHVYNIPGTYSVSLKVTDSNGCIDSIRHANIIIISKPVAAFKSDTLSCSLKGIVFTNLSSGPALTYQWNFGDGTTSVQPNPIHTYDTEGIYTVSLSIIDQFGCSDFISKANYIKIANPKADFLASDTIGRCPPLVVNFTNTSKNYLSWSWDFGDGTSSSSQSPSHFYSTPGTFYATLSITGPGGCTDTKNVKIKVMGPIGSFTYNNISGCKPLQTNFRATTGKSTTFVWDFNDGTTSVTPDSIVSHTFQTAGFYLPRMILSDTTGCKIPITGFDSIKVFGVVASFTNPGKTLCDSGLVSFTNTSQSNDAFAGFSWNFGDNTSSTLENPIHNYRTTGFYNSKLFIVTKNGCKDSVSVPSSVKVVKSPV
ncbi:MAG: PKD domain-containing protein, partial [Bacteroidota bacterium]|nr:PKD domain-containing protein [Bacteroidota bacterium]